MSLSQMPKTNRAGRANPFFAAPFSFDFTYWARLCAAIGEILAMYCAVTGLAKRDTVVCVKSEMVMGRPGLDMMGVKLAPIPVLLAGISITFKNSAAPCFKLWRKPGTITQSDLPSL